MTSKEISNCLGDHHKAYYILHVIQKYMHYYMWHMGIGENFCSAKKHIFLYQKDRTRSRSVPVYSDLSYDTSLAHRRGYDDK